VKKEGGGEPTGLIRRIQERHHCRYPRVREALRRDYGKRASRKKAARLTRENGLSARGRRKFIPASRKSAVRAGRGGRYRTKAFPERLKELCPPVRRSMRGKRNCSGFCPRRIVFQDPEERTGNLGHAAGEVRQPVFMYIEPYYNRIRTRSALGYVAPHVFNSGQAA
jgi:transposase InsO family protein